MALVQLGTIITNIKGSISGTTFSNCRNGTVAKKRVTGKRLTTTKQADSLNTSKLITNAWNALSVLQQNDFNAYALANTFTDRYGVTKKLTGFQWFKQLSYASYYWSGTTLIIPPAHATPSALPSFTVSLNTTTMQFTWSTPIDPGTLYLLFFTSPPIKQNMLLSRSAYRLTDIRALSYGSTFNFTSAWEQAHGLTYSAIAASGKYNINVLVVPINKASFVSGNAAKGIGSFSSIPSGIGAMAIGSTFVIN
jgi:hypothetical protein